MRKFNPELDAVLTKSGLTDMEKAILVERIVSTLSSGRGRVQGITNSIADMERQRDEVQKEVDATAALVDKVTVEIEE